jgi:hypothetical protein
MSVYGDIIVNYVSPGGAATPVASIQGVAVYSPTPARKFRIGLLKHPALNYNEGRLIVSYLPKIPNAAPLAKQEMSLSTHLVSFAK